MVFLPGEIGCARLYATISSLAPMAATWRVAAVISAEVDEAVLGVAQLGGVRQDRVQDGVQVEGRPPQRLQNVANSRLVGDQPLDILIIGPVTPGSVALAWRNPTGRSAGRREFLVDGDLSQQELPFGEAPPTRASG